MEEYTNYKQELESLRSAGFSTRDITRLYQLRRSYVTNEWDRAPADQSRLRFVRWLVETGRLTDQLA
jgi:hypothetical protein